MSTRSTNDDWAGHAEQLLYDIASDLRRAPFGGPTTRLHLRALALKREVARWRASPPPPTEVHSTLDELEQLAREARAASALRRPGPAGIPAMRSSSSRVPRSC